MLEKIKAGLKRFVKVFLGAGVAQVIVALAPGFNVGTLDDLHKLSILLLNAFVAGALLGLLKLVQYS